MRGRLPTERERESGGAAMGGGGGFDGAQQVVALLKILPERGEEAHEGRPGQKQQRPER
jgi:hypothetical protein